MAKVVTGVVQVTTPLDLNAIMQPENLVKLGDLDFGTPSFEVSAYIMAVQPDIDEPTSAVGTLIFIHALEPATFYRKKNDADRA